MTDFPPDAVQSHRALVGLLRAERRVYRAVLDVVDDWLEATRFVILREAAQQSGMVAAGYPDPSGAVDAASAAYETWRRGVTDRLLPEVSIAFGEAYRQVRAGHPAQRYETEWLETVSDRLRIWPEDAFDDIRPELIEALAEGEDFDQMRDRVGMVLGIDSRTRELRAEITEIETRLQAEDLGPVTRKALIARRRILWEAHDESLGDWQWKARRIARTEAYAAVEWGRMKAAEDAAAESGREMFKRWRATPDNRVRPTHRVADGQVVKLHEKFQVGEAKLRFPGDPTAGFPHEVIHCRCTASIYSGDMVQDGLQGPDGSIGAVEPGGVRLGPDDPDKVADAVAAVADDRTTTPPLTAPEAPADLTGLDDDELLAVMERAHDAGDDDLYDRADAEWERRDADRYADVIDDGVADDESLTESGWSAEDEQLMEWLAAEEAWRYDVEAWLDAESEWQERPTVHGPQLGGPEVEDGDDLAAHLDTTMPGDDLDDEEHTAVLRWQGMDRFYQQVQQELRGEGGSAEAEQIVDILDEIIDAHPLDRDVVTWRGIRNAHAMFNVGSDDLDSVVGSVIPPGGFIATSASREVAVSFTEPGRDPVLLRLTVASGTGALWVSAAGAPDLQGQRELLFGATALYIVGVSRTEDGFTQIDVEMR